MKNISRLILIIFISVSVLSGCSSQGASAEKNDIQKNNSPKTEVIPSNKSNTSDVNKKEEASKKPAVSKKVSTDKNKTAAAKKTAPVKTNTVVVKPAAAKKSADESAIPAIPEKYSFIYLKDFESEILKYVNIERENAGLKLLSLDTKLITIAEYKADEMLQYDYFSHVSPYTGDPMNLASKYFKYDSMGYGENILYYKGYELSEISAKMMVDAWMNSPGHRENILNDSWTKLGVGVVYSKDENYTYAVQHFSN